MGSVGVATEIENEVEVEEEEVEVEEEEEETKSRREVIEEKKLEELFKKQAEHINFFFKNIDIQNIHRFTRILLEKQQQQQNVGGGGVGGGGCLFFTGVGKSSFISKKISQTLVSLGIRSSFLSPLDALHGDIGILSPSDLLIFFSKSGSTDELLRLVPCVRSKGLFLISVTSVPSNPLSSLCDFNVHLPLDGELCPFDLAPVTSTSIQLLFGDTVAIALMLSLNLTKQQYASNHPAGRIGKSLLFKVKDVMKKHEEENVPVCKEGDLIMDQLVQLTSKGCGCLLVVDDHQHLIGTFTDGDLRRTLNSYREAIFNLTVGNICNRSPRTINPDAMAVEAMKKMESPPSPVQFLPVINQDNVLLGIITLHGLVSAGL